MLAGYHMHISKPAELAELIAVVASLAGRTVGDGKSKSRRRGRAAR